MEKRLGRGLGSLLGEKPEVVAPKDARELPVSEIRPNPYQPRKTFARWNHLGKDTDSITDQLRILMDAFDDQAPVFVILICSRRNRDV